MKKTFGFSIKDIAEIAIFSALAIVLDRVVRIPLGATGGSVNISLVPLYVIALRHGWFKSFIAGSIIYGLITCLFDCLYCHLCVPRTQLSNRVPQCLFYSSDNSLCRAHCQSCSHSTIW